MWQALLDIQLHLMPLPLTVCPDVFTGNFWFAGYSQVEGTFSPFFLPPSTHKTKLLKWLAESVHQTLPTTLYSIVCFCSYIVWVLKHLSCVYKLICLGIVTIRLFTKALNKPH